jgi:hypothetical protein
MLYAGLHRKVNRVARLLRRSALLLCLLLSVSLVGGIAFAGTDFSNGGNRTNGTKAGVDNKKDAGCGTDYTLWPEFGEGVYYDLNGDDWICYKFSDFVYWFTDNTATVKD